MHENALKSLDFLISTIHKLDIFVGKVSHFLPLKCWSRDASQDALSNVSSSLKTRNWKFLLWSALFFCHVF